jgi:hypothetical protein
MCPDVDSFLKIASKQDSIWSECRPQREFYVLKYLGFKDNVNKIKRVGTFRVNKIISSILTLPE